MCQLEKTGVNYKLGIYQAPEGGIVFDVDVESETLWATQTQIAQLFDVDKTVISRHLKNIYREEELEEEKTCQKRNEIRTEGERQVKREVKRYNLDAIISVGYRVNSMKATKFRVWSNKILKEYITHGVVVNKTQLAQSTDAEAVKRLNEIKGAMAIIERVISQNELSGGEASGVIEVMAKYTKSFQTISEFLNGQFLLTSNKRSRHELSGVEIENLVIDLREKMGETDDFGALVDDKNDFEGVAKWLRDGYEASDTVAKKAAKILYNVVKREPFKRGNQQIGGLLFVVYLAMNQLQLSSMGETKISDRALTALVLLISESEFGEEGLLIDLICKLLEQ